MAEAPSNISMADKVRLNKDVFWFMFLSFGQSAFATMRLHSVRQKYFIGQEGLVGRLLGSHALGRNKKCLTVCLRKNLSIFAPP